MKKTIAAFFLASILFIGCQKEEIFPTARLSSITPDYSGQFTNTEIDIVVGSRSVKGYLSKPAGTDLDMVLVLHGGTLNYQSSINATLNQATKPDGGQQFLANGRAILSLAYTEYADAADTIGVTKGIMEMEEVLAAVDFLQSDPFVSNNFTINNLYAFGHSRGGANALLAGIERELNAVISAEGPLNWKAIKDSTISGFLTPTPKQLFNFVAGTAAWNADTSLWTTYSPALRLEEFQTPFLVLAGELDEATFQDMAVQMQNNYNNCGSCIDGGTFNLHSFGHTDWSLEPGILDSIQDFINRY